MKDGKTDYARILEELGVNPESVAQDISSLKRGRFPKHVLDTVLDNKTPESPYRSALVDAVGRGLMEEGINLMAAMKDALSYITKREGEIPKRMAAYLGDDGAASEIITDYCLVMLEIQRKDRKGRKRR